MRIKGKWGGDELPWSRLVCIIFAGRLSFLSPCHHPFTLFFLRWNLEPRRLTTALVFKDGRDVIVHYVLREHVLSFRTGRLASHVKTQVLIDIGWAATVDLAKCHFVVDHVKVALNFCSILNSPKRVNVTSVMSHTLQPQTKQTVNDAHMT